MSDVLKPRGPLSRKGLIKCLSTTLLDAAELTRESLEKNGKLLKWMAQIELPVEFEHALLAGLANSHNSSRSLAMLALRNLVELDPEWAKPEHVFPPEMTIEEQYESLAQWRAKYDAAVKESQAEAEREAATEWPVAKVPDHG